MNYYDDYNYYDTGRKYNTILRTRVCLGGIDLHISSCMYIHDRVINKLKSNRVLQYFNIHTI